MRVPWKKTIRRMPPKTRAFAHALRELHLSVGWLEKQLPVIAGLEIDSRALASARVLIAPDQPRPGKPAGPDLAAALEAEETPAADAPAEPAAVEA